MDERTPTEERDVPVWKSTLPAVLSLISVAFLLVAFVLLYSHVSNVFDPDADLLKGGVQDDPFGNSATIFSPWVIAVSIASFLLAVWAASLSIVRLIRGTSSFWNVFGLITGGGLTLAFLMMMAAGWVAYSHFKDTVAEFKEMEAEGDKLGALGQELCAQLALTDLATRQESHQRTHGAYTKNLDALDWKPIPGMCDHFQFGTDGLSV